MEFKDYYAVLGVERDATQDEIKRAYRKLARKYHPDVSKEADADARFKELGEAYEVLKDPEKRLAYDQVGRGQRAGQDFRPPPDWDTGFEFRGGGYTQEGYSREDSAAFSDFFESLFGQRRGFGSTGFGSDGFTHGESDGARYRTRGASVRGEDHHAKVAIALEDAYRGAARTLTLQSGEIDEQGRLRSRHRTLKVRIPKGVKQGQRIRLSGQGEPGLGGGPAGDLYRIGAASALSGGRARRHGEAPRRALGGGIGRHGDGPDARRFRGDEDSTGLPERAAPATQGPRYTRSAAGGLLRDPGGRPAFGEA